MIVAITSTGNNLNSTLDKHFGRCAFFVFYDSATGGVEFLPNPNREVEENAGAAAMQILTSRKAEKVISGEFGAKIKPMIDSLQIQMIMLKNSSKTIQEIIDLLHHKKQ